MENDGLAIVPEEARPEDVVCTILGAAAPCVLRPNENGCWTLISGDCHIAEDPRSGENSVWEDPESGDYFIWEGSSHFTYPTSANFRGMIRCYYNMKDAPSCDSVHVLLGRWRPHLQEDCVRTFGHRAERFVLR